MLWILLVAAASFLFSLLFTPVVRWFALAQNWVDCPDDCRKTHKVPIPRIGGVAVVLAYSGSLAVLLIVRGSPTFIARQPSPVIEKLFAAALLVFAIGILDDIIGLKPWHKLSAEIVAAGLAYLGGLHVQTVAGHEVAPFLDFTLTILWLISCTNAFNLIDGLDGLSSGLGFLASSTIFVAGLLQGNLGLMLATAPLSGALLGFLRFNFNPASIFLGDCGSLWVGFMLGCYGLLWCQKSETVLGVTAPLMVLCIPLLDTVLSVVRRFLRRQPIFAADRGHIHHRLLDQGLTPRRTAVLLYAATAVGACFSLIQSNVAGSARALIPPVFCVAVCIGIRSLKYQEFSVAARLAWKNTFRSSVKAHVLLKTYEEALISASSVEECWQAIRVAGREFGFSEVALKLGSQSYEESFENSPEGHWVLHVPLSRSAYVRFTGQFGRHSSCPIIMSFVDVLYNVLSLRVTELIELDPVLHVSLEIKPAASEEHSPYQFRPALPKI